MFIDWIKITGDLRKHHGSLARAAREIGCSAETVRQINRGEIKEPKFMLGIRIIDAHYDIKTQPLPNQADR